MSRLPTPGSDSGTWGDILNDYLSKEHNSDGTQKTLPLTKGGTGATDSSTARTNLGTVSTTDSRLTDSRIPTNGSVTDAKITSGGLSPSKITGTAAVAGDLISKADDSSVVHKSGTETITGAKDFTVNIAAPGYMVARLPTTDHTANGIKTTAVANETQAIGDAVCVGSDGKWSLAKADAIANATAVAIVCDAPITQDATGNYLLFGTIRDDTWSWTVGAPIYLSATGTTGNTLTQTAPSGANNVIQILGIATSTDEMIFSPQLVQVEHV